jgi:hypothetical protein
MRYFIVFIATLGLLFLLLYLLLHGGGKAKVPATHKPLISYSTTDAQAILTIDGPINSQQEHRAVRITVGQDEVTYQQIQGYQNSVLNQQSFDSNQDAYVNFLAALQHAGFTQGSINPLLKDERGYCPLGERYIFEFNQDGQQLQRYWATSCGSNSPATYKGSLALTLDLFEAQVPGFSQLTQNLGFNP